VNAQDWITDAAESISVISYDDALSLVELLPFAARENLYQALCSLHVGEDV
jgi:hypothetical protein